MLSEPTDTLILIHDEHRTHCETGISLFQLLKPMLVKVGSALVLKVSDPLLSASLQKKQNAFCFVVKIVNQGYILN